MSSTVFTLLKAQRVLPVAVLDKMPNVAIISGLKGTLDFYLWKGIPCCRTWPRHKPRWRSPAEIATTTVFAYASSTWKNLPAEVRQAYESQVAGIGFRAIELHMRAYIGGINY